MYSDTKRYVANVMALKRQFELSGDRDRAHAHRRVSSAARPGRVHAAEPRRLRIVDTTVKDPLVGRVLDGRYRVGSRLARGGMATVYEAARHPARPHDRPQGDAPEPGRRRRVRLPLHPRGQLGGPAVPPQRRRRLRPGRRPGARLPRDGARPRPHPARPDARARPPQPAPGARGPRAGARRARRRPPGRHHPPRRQARERPALRRRPGQGRRLRAGPRGHRRHQPHHDDRRPDGHGRLPLPRAGRARRRRPALRRLRGRHPALRDAHRLQAVRRRDRHPGRLPARPRRRAAALVAGARACPPSSTPWSPAPPAATPTSGRPTPAGSWPRCSPRGRPLSDGELDTLGPGPGRDPDAGTDQTMVVDLREDRDAAPRRGDTGPLGAPRRHRPGPPAASSRGPLALLLDRRCWRSSCPASAWLYVAEGRSTDHDPRAARPDPGRGRRPRPRRTGSTSRVKGHGVQRGRRQGPGRRHRPGPRRQHRQGRHRSA